MFEPPRKAVPRSRVDARAGFSSAHRFSGGGGGGGGGYGGGATSTGPGMYDVKNTWVKKSYNITFTNKKSGAGSGKTGRRY